MQLTVFYEDGTEKSFKNVTDVHTSVRYDDETKKPVYKMRIASLGDLSVVDLHGIKNFQINDINDAIFCSDGIWYCASCGTTFPSITKSEIDRYMYKWCPYCGKYRRIL